MCGNRKKIEHFLKRGYHFDLDVAIMYLVEEFYFPQSCTNCSPSRLFGSAKPSDVCGTDAAVCGVLSARGELPCDVLAGEKTAKCLKTVIKFKKIERSLPDAEPVRAGRKKI